MYNVVLKKKHYFTKKAFLLKRQYVFQFSFALVVSLPTLLYEMNGFIFKHEYDRSERNREQIGFILTCMPPRSY